MSFLDRLANLDVEDIALSDGHCFLKRGIFQNLQTNLDVIRISRFDPQLSGTDHVSIGASGAQR